MKKPSNSNDQSNRLRVPRRVLARFTRKQPTITRLLLEQIDTALEATALANRVCSREADAEESRSPMRKFEHEGDDARANLVDRIDVALTVPLEREDLFRASRYIDDVTDSLRDLVREMALWNVPTGRWSRGALTPAVDSLKELRRAVKTDDWTQSRKHCLRARRHTNRLRRNYQNGLTDIFEQPLTVDTLKIREILRRIDSIGSRLSDVSDALLDGMIKRYL